MQRRLSVVHATTGASRGLASAEVRMCHIWIHYDPLHDVTFWDLLNLFEGEHGLIRTYSNEQQSDAANQQLMLKGDGQKMVTGRFSQCQFHVVLEAHPADWQDAI